MSKPELEELIKYATKKLDNINNCTLGNLNYGEFFIWKEENRTIIGIFCGNYEIYDTTYNCITLYDTFSKAHNKVHNISLNFDGKVTKLELSEIYNRVKTLWGKR